MAGTYSNLIIHLVFSTKNREPFINNPDFQNRLYDYLGGCIRTRGGTPYLINGVADHVHLLLQWIPDGKLSDLLRDMKSGSSKWVHDTFPDRKRFAWQEGYGAFSVSCSQVPAGRAYIANQEQHHHKCDFKAELRGLLKRHDIQWDEKTIWL